MSPAAPPLDDRLLWDGLLACYRLPALAVADELGLFARLAEAPLPLPALASALGIAPRACQALCGVLVAMGVLCATASPGDIGLAPAARPFLLPGQPAYWGPALRLFRDSPIHYRSVLQAVTNADTPAWPRLQADLWTQHQADPATAAAFADVMDAQGHAPARAMAAQPCFSHVRHLLDVGGGSGAYAIALARAWPQLRVTILDLAATCVHAAQRIAQAGLHERIQVVAADMWHDPWPAGLDAVLMSNVLHDWSPERCRTLLGRAHASLQPGGWLHLHEMLLDEDGAHPATVAAYSLDMLLYTDGRQYRRSELDALLQTTGYTETVTSATCGYFSLVSAQRAQDH